jgi:hypothetical protein
MVTSPLVHPLPVAALLTASLTAPAAVVFWMASISEANDLTQHPYIGGGDFAVDLGVRRDHDSGHSGAGRRFRDGSPGDSPGPRWFGAVGVLVGAAAVLSGFTGGLLSLVGLLWIAALSLTLTLRLLRGRTAEVVAR